MQSKNKIRDFLEEYQLVTYEGILVALLIATLALVGVYRMLFVPCIIQTILIYIVITYKRLKWETTRAITAKNLEIPLTEIARDEREKGIKVKYYSDNGISRKIKQSTFYSLVLLSCSIVMVVVFPLLDEQKKHKQSEKIHSELIVLSHDVISLNSTLDSMIQVIKQLENTKNVTIIQGIANDTSKYK